MANTMIKTTAQYRAFAAANATSDFEGHDIERVARLVLATRKRRIDRSAAEMVANIKRNEPALFQHVLAALA